MPRDPAAHLPSGGAPPPSPTTLLLRDGSLTLRVHPSLARIAAPWIPLAPDASGSRDASPAHPPAFRRDRAAPARIRVGPARGRPATAPAGEPAVEVLRVRGWLDEGAARMHLAAPDGAVQGTVDLARRLATLRVSAAARFSHLVRTDLACALTIAAGTLLGRGGRALVHAAGVVAPDGRAWLLVGDSFSGKTTTCVNLIRAGWDWLADDQVVVMEEAGGVRVEGWPRRFALDEGFAAGRTLGRRALVGPEGMGPGRWRRSAPLGGVLLPRVQADEPTRLEPAHPADALGTLVRQSPWLLADREAAPGVLALLTRMSKTVVFRLRLGRDSYTDYSLLHQRVSAAAATSREPEESRIP